MLRTNVCARSWNMIRFMRVGLRRFAVRGGLGLDDERMGAVAVARDVWILAWGPVLWGPALWGPALWAEDFPVLRRAPRLPLRLPPAAAAVCKLGITSAYVRTGGFLHDRRAGSRPAAACRPAVTTFASPLRLPVLPDPFPSLVLAGFLSSGIGVPQAVNPPPGTGALFPGALFVGALFVGALFVGAFFTGGLFAGGLAGTPPLCNRELTSCTLS